MSISPFIVFLLSLKLYYDYVSSDLTVQDISSQVTVNTSTVASCGYKVIYKYGKLVQVFLGNFILNAQGNNQLIVSGLPRAVCQMGALTSGLDAAKTAQIQASGECAWVETGSTSLRIHAGSAYSQNHWLSLTYLCE